MEKEKADRIVSMLNWVRFIILVLFLTLVFATLAKAAATPLDGMWLP
jgi:hypothetical protein